MLKEKYQKIIVIFSIGLFLIAKLFSLDFRFGDSNAYFYMADQLFQGVLPYRDYFLADPPLLIFILAVYKLLIGKNLLLLQAFPFILEAANAIWLYYILKKEVRFGAWLAPGLYLFSFSILSLSDFLTGIQLVNFFCLTAIFFFQKNRLKLSGFFWGLAFLVKLYGVFLFLGFLIFWLAKKNFAVLRPLLLGASGAVLLLIFPFFLISPHSVFSDLIIHHLNRPVGNSKSLVFGFFFQKEWFFIFLGLAGLFSSRKWSLGAPAIALLIFLLFFQDLYYTYLGAFLPFLVILSLIFIDFLFQRPAWRGLLPLFGGICLIFLVWQAKSYQSQHLLFGRFSNAQIIADYFNQLPGQKLLYGSHEVAPLIALLSNSRLLNNYIDTNPQTFGSGVHQKELISQEVIEKKAYLIGRIVRQPEISPFDAGFEGYFDEKIFQERCRSLKDFPSTSNEWDNFIVIYQCF